MEEEFLVVLMVHILFHMRFHKGPAVIMKFIGGKKAGDGYKKKLAKVVTLIQRH